MHNFFGLVDEIEVPDGYETYIWADSCCFDGIEWCKRNGKKYRILSEWNMNANEVYHTYLYFEEVRKKIVKYTTSLLNEYQNLSYGENDWSTLISPFLLIVIPSFYDKYTKLKMALNKYENLETRLVRTNKLNVSLDYYDTVFLAYESTDYHRYLCSLMLPILDKKKKIHVISSEYVRDEMKTYSNDLPDYVRTFVERYDSYKEEEKVDDDIVIQSSCIKFSVYKKIIERNYGRISGYFFDYYTDVRNGLRRDLDSEWRFRERKERCDDSDEFVSLLYRLLPQILPIAYVEDFKDIKRIAEKNYKWGMHPKAVVYDTMELHSDEMFKIYLMTLGKQKIKRIGVQHAGFYGFGGDIWGKLFELSQYDEFLGTGCDSDVFQHTNIIQMPLLIFFRMPNLSRSPSEKILFLNTASPKNCSWLATKQCDYYIEKDISFLKGLGEDILRKVIIRYYPFVGFGYDIKRSIKQAIPDIRFDTQKNLYDSLRDTKLLISSGIGTSVLQAIHAGIPTIIMHHPMIGHHVLSKASRDLELIDEMIASELIAETPEHLVQIVNRIEDCVEEWWNDSERKKVVEKLMNRCAYFPENAEKIWVDRVSSYSTIDMA